jgi:hypothetical protein
MLEGGRQRRKRTGGTLGRMRPPHRQKENARGVGVPEAGDAEGDEGERGGGREGGEGGSRN